jgi:MYXO-CTERM domain-containing protein
VDVVFGAAESELTLVANFGLIRRDGGALRYTCEGALGGLAVRARRLASGEWLVGSAQGVLRHQAAGCSDQPQLVQLDGSEVVDLLVATERPDRVWALTAVPAALHRSDDGGRSFTRRFSFPAGEQPLKLAQGGASGAASALYAAGEDAGGRLLLRRSDDGGDSFQPPAGQPPAGIPRELLGVAPDQPGTVFAVLRARDGAGEQDEVWRTRDGGGSWQRVLALPASEGLGGFSFGSGNTIYLGVREVLFGAAGAPARLLVSRDGGDSWQPPIPSPRNGPRFRCLAARGDRLDACAGGLPNGDDFLLGYSTDGGHKWTPVMTVDEIAGPEPCQRATCLPTSEWLCATYALCEDRPRDGGPTPDAGPLSPPQNDGDGGCGCTLGGSAARSTPALPLLILPILLAIRRRLSRRPGPGPAPPPRRR